jgi:hypothetical protein
MFWGPISSIFVSKSFLRIIQPLEPSSAILDWFEQEFPFVTSVRDMPYSPVVNGSLLLALV